jgi:NSS family neurotransmitter:Na+ symporter
VQEGVEKWIGATMPLFAFLLVVLMIKSLSLATAGDAIRFLFYPDFAKLKLSSPLHAIGHVCFTLSVGFGSMVTLRGDSNFYTLDFPTFMPSVNR